MKKIIAMIVIATFVIGFNVVPARAYNPLKTPVSISANGTITGVTQELTVTVVTQNSADAPASLAFENPSGLTDSDEALKIATGSNVVGARVIIYTDNDNNGNTQPTTVDAATGIDGSGLVGKTDPAYAVAFKWGAKSSVDNDPNDNSEYNFSTQESVYIVDMRHTDSFTTVGGSLDNNGPMYDSLGASYANTNDDGLYPQLFLEDLYDADPTAGPAIVVSEALYKNIATVAFGLTDSGGGTYLCRVPKLDTPAVWNDNVSANIGTGIYVALAADFTGKPAQDYGTDKLYVAIVQD